MARQNETALAGAELIAGEAVCDGERGLRPYLWANVVVDDERVSVGVDKRDPVISRTRAKMAGIVGDIGTETQ